MYKVCITKRPREILQRLTDFWIKKNDILRLFECLELSELFSVLQYGLTKIFIHVYVACYQKSRCDRIVALCILLKRLSNPCRCKDMVPLFAWNPTGLRLIFTLDFLYQLHHHITRICKQKWCMAATLGQWCKIPDCAFGRSLDFQPWRVVRKPKIWLCTMLYELGLLK